MKRRRILVVSLGGANHSFWVKKILTFSERLRSNLSLRSFLWKTWEGPWTHFPSVKTKTLATGKTPGKMFFFFLPTYLFHVGNGGFF